MEKLKQSINDYEKQMVIFNDALENYRKKKEFTENLAKTKKELEARITSNESAWENGIIDSNGCLTNDAEKSSFMVATAKEQLEKIIALQDSAFLEFLEASLNLHKKASDVEVARRKLCNHATKTAVDELTEKAVSAVRLLGAVNAVGAMTEEPYNLRNKLSEALSKGESDREAAEAYISFAIAGGNEHLKAIPAALPDIAYTISHKCPSPCQMSLARTNKDFLSRLISGAEPLKGARYS
ncbi:hypothetical protein NAK99_000344 [Escherichia coli]|nr:hypothetical protein [Escherichia coli]